MKQLFFGMISLGGLITLLLFAPMTASAHPEDDFVQASYITLTGDEILLDIDFRPGYEISSQVLTAIDTNGDGIISELEGTVYADEVTDAIIFEVDGEAVALTRLAVAYPSASMFEDALGIIQFHFSAPLPATDSGDYQIHYENGFAPEEFTSHYLVNGFVETAVQDSVDITNQERDWDQRTITLSYSITSAPVASASDGADNVDEEESLVEHLWEHFIEYVHDVVASLGS